MKTLTGAIATAAGTPLGEEPLIVVKIEWATGARWYADRDLTLHAAEGRILDASHLTAQSKQDAVGTVSAMSFRFDDGDGIIKGLLDTNCAEGTVAYVYEVFESARDPADLTILLKGVIVEPEWSEGERQFTFEIETRVQDLEVGFAIEQDTYETLVVDEPLLTDEAIGKAWPLCFGSNVHLPMLKLLAPPETSLNGTYKKGDASFLVEDASRFPDAASVDVIIDGMVFTCTVDKVNNRFHVGEANVAKYQSIPFAAREADEDASNPWVAWISQDVSLANTFIYFTSEYGNTVYHRVIRQEGRKIWMDPRIVQKKAGGSIFNTGFSVVPIPLEPPSVIAEAARYGRDGWGIEMSYVGGATTSNGRLQVGGFRDTAQVISGVTWKFASGEVVRLWSYPSGSALHPVKYVANLIPSSTVKAVFAWRRNPKTGRRAFKAIPSSYYTVNLSESVFGQTATTVTLKQPMTEYFGQGWSETIYVSLKSSVGPNGSNIIKWLLENYSNLAVDASSFASVATSLTNYPCAIFLQSKGNVIQLCEDIAWKSRCALLIEDGVAKLKYLSAEPSADFEIDEAQVEYKTLHLKSTRTEDIVTRFTAHWLLDHSGRPQKARTLVKTENVTKFGLKRREVNFDIYNVESLVEKSARFWAHRMANSWRVAKLNVLDRSALALEMLDCVSVAFSDASLLGGTFKTILDARSNDLGEDDSTFGLSLWLPSLAGTLVQEANAWMDDSGDTLPADPVDNLSETTIDEQWADDMSHSFVNHRITSRPAKIVNVSADGFGFNVDIFDDGYEDEDGIELPPTNKDSAGVRIVFVAYPIDMSLAMDRAFPAGAQAFGIPADGLEKYRNILREGTKIQIFNVHGARWMFNVPVDRGHVLSKINGPTVDALGRIGTTLYPDGFDQAGTLTEVKAYHAGDVDAATVGDKGITLQHGDIRVFFPLGGTSGTQVKPYLISTNDGGGNYTAQEYDMPYGLEVGDLVSNLYELNGSPNVQPGWWVYGITFGDYVYFDRPDGAC